MGLDSTGLTILNFQQLLNQLSAKTKEMMGDDMNTDQNSVVGMYIRIISWLQNIVNQDLEAVYYSNFVDQAEGISLDRLGSNYSVTRNPAQAATVMLNFTGTTGTVIPEETVYTTESGVEFEMVDTVTLDDSGKGSGEAVCTALDETGNVAPNTISVQGENIAGVESVTNPTQASGGAEIETDDAYRQRIHLNMESQPGPTYYGLYTGLYALPGVEQVQIVPNLTMETDSYGNPPKSLHFYVRGGREDDVAQAILDNIAAGIQTVGKIKKAVKDIGGHTHDVFFDTATVVPIYVSMSLKTSDGFNSETSPVEIVQAIKDYLSGLIMGDKVVFTKLYQAIYNISGVEYAQVTLGRDKSAMGMADIQLDQFETAVVANDSDVEVTVDDG
ncbi:baseplate J/gp47 family protein [Levilactobacillus brevis]|uniref:baseplate J/gp47 family protein n=1 Tax=Levilactobacillus brevis TaxID=1580 RepID=UPI000BE81F26|nr:baseplate J/gp47 family protein [Levilactobacillus brevis]MCZ2118644.1 baseplate J/gp47 family protein [Levilactobacillus brevis]MCZ2124172.1 baseplate J/gp47 family protein [Levilactobacillus brevis]MCZ2208492.1 baseplate J/gp47 family protein [Levilactobacillus brevis]MCZ2323956.1 baseplate J/gp47 family protein [Levilactobacillus brevis]